MTDAMALAATKTMQSELSYCNLEEAVPPAEMLKYKQEIEVIVLFPTCTRRLLGV